jgi:hypothetical protein
MLEDRQSNLVDDLRWRMSWKNQKNLPFLVRMTNVKSIRRLGPRGFCDLRLSCIPFPHYWNEKMLAIDPWNDVEWDKLLS